MKDYKRTQIRNKQVVTVHKVAIDRHLASWFKQQRIFVGYRREGSSFESWWGQEVFLFSKAFTLPLGPYKSSYSMYTGVLRPEREVHYSRPSCIKVMNEWSPTCAVSICFHGVDMDTFISAALMEVFLVVSLNSCRQTSYGTANYATTGFFHVLSSSSFSVPPITGHTRTYYELLATSINVPQKGRVVPAHAIEKA